MKKTSTYILQNEQGVSTTEYAMIACLLGVVATGVYLNTGEQTAETSEVAAEAIYTRGQYMGIKDPKKLGEEYIKTGAPMRLAPGKKMHVHMTKNKGSVIKPPHNAEPISGNGSVEITTEENGVKFTAANSYSGGTTVNSGELIASNSKALGSGPVVLGSGSTQSNPVGLTWSGNANAFGNDVVVTRTSSTQPPTITGGQGSTGQIDSNIILERSVNLVDETGSGTNFSGQISGNGAVNVSGTKVVLSGANNSFSGPVTVEESSTLQLDSPKAVSQSTDVELHNSKLVLKTKATTDIDSLNGYGSVTVKPEGSGTATLTTGNNNGDANFNGVLKDGDADSKLALVKNGNGYLALYGPSDYSGGTNINGGTVYARHTKALGTGPVTLKGGTLKLEGRTIPNTITLYPGSVLDLGRADAKDLKIVNKGGTILYDHKGKKIVYKSGNVIVPAGDTHIGYSTVSQTRRSKVTYTIKGGLETTVFHTAQSGGNYSGGGSISTVNVEKNGTLDVGTMYLSRTCYCNYTYAKTALKISGEANIQALKAPKRPWGSGGNRAMRYVDLNSGGVLRSNLIDFHDHFKGRDKQYLNFQMKGGTLENMNDKPLQVDHRTPISLSNANTINISKSIAYIKSPIKGTGSLTMNGSGSVVLTNSNSYNGGTTIKSGKVYARNEQALGTGTVELRGGELRLEGRAVKNTIYVYPGATLLTGGVDTSRLKVVNKGGSVR